MVAAHSIKIADAGERTAAFRRARLNSVMVRLMRWLLPVGAVLLLSSYALFMQRTIKIETKTHSGKLNTGTVSAALDNLSMSNPSYEGYNKKDGSRYRVSAKRAITDLSRDKPIELHEIDGSFQQRNGQTTAVSARHGSFDQTAATLNLDGGIRLQAPNGLSAELTNARIDTKTAEITSSDPVLVRLPAGQVRSNGMRLDQRAREILFMDGVAAKLKPRQPAPGSPVSRVPSVVSSPAPAPVPAQVPVPVQVMSPPSAPSAVAEPGAVLGFGGASSAPVDISSATLAIAEKQRTAHFIGSVRATQSGRVLETPSLLVRFDREAAPGDETGASKAVAGAMLNTRGRLRTIVVKDGLKLSQGGNLVVADAAEFDVEKHQAQLTGKVRISAPAGRSIDADRAAIDTATNTVVLTGRVVARQADSLLRGNWLKYEPKLGRMQLASPAVEGVPRGDIYVRFNTADANRNRAQRPRADQAGLAFSTNPDAPVEIAARSMDVQDARSTARFEGAVRAKQGDFTLTTPVMTALYQGRIGLLNDPASEASAAGRATPARTQLRLIRATNPVMVSSGSDMKANGENAEFDMAANTVTISGNVVLQRGRQIIRGDRLIIDLKTGLSRMKNAAPDQKTVKPLVFGAPPQITANPNARDCGGQMCAVFFPADIQKQQADRQRSGASRSGSSPSGGRTTSPRKPRLDSGWSTETKVN